MLIRYMKAVLFGAIVLAVAFTLLALAAVL